MQAKSLPSSASNGPPSIMLEQYPTPDHFSTNYDQDVEKHFKVFESWYVLLHKTTYQPHLIKIIGCAIYYSCIEITTTNPSNQHWQRASFCDLVWWFQIAWSPWPFTALPQRYQKLCQGILYTSGYWRCKWNPRQIMAKIGSSMTFICLF